MGKKDGKNKNDGERPDPHPGPLIHSAARAIVPARPEDENDPEVIRKRLATQQRYAEAAQRAKERRKKSRKVVFTEDDERDYSELLLEAFPGIRFVSLDDVSDQKILSAADAVGRPLQLRYFDSLAEHRVYSFFCWLEPEGWEPEIAPDPLTPGKFQVVNLPRLRFSYESDRGILEDGYFFSSSFRVLKKPLPPLWSRDAGAFHARFRIDDEEHQAFVRKAFRLVTKIASNRLFWVDQITGRAMGPPNKRGTDIWAGNHALAWCRENPRHLLCDNLRPEEEYEERSKIPELHPDYLSSEEGQRRLYIRAEAELQAFYEEVLAHRREMAKQQMSETAAKIRSKSANPPKKKGG